MSQTQVWNRRKLISELRKISIEGKDAFFKPSEDFDGNDGGIWTGGEGNPSLMDNFTDDEGKTYSCEMGMFDYQYEYNPRSIYTDFGVHPKVQAILDEAGWFAEWHDGGTMFLWKA